MNSLPEEDWRKRQEIEHRQKYEAKAQKLGVKALKQLVPIPKGGIEALRKCYEDDKYLNNIPLVYWDSKDRSVRQLVRESGGGIWSLCDTVCTLKHVAVVHILGEETENF